MFLCRETKKSYNSQLRAACEAALQEIKESVGEQGKIGIVLFSKKSYIVNPYGKNLRYFTIIVMRWKKRVSRKI